MNVLVMSDGSAAATKAIELAGIPGGPLMPSHEKAQLIIAHMWEKTPAFGAVFSPDAVDGGAAGGAGGVDYAAASTTTANAAAAVVDPGNSSNGCAGGNITKAPQTVEAAVRAAVQTANASLNAFSIANEKGGGGGNHTSSAGAADTGAAAGSPSKPAAAMLSQQLPVVFVLQRALQAIHESKTLKDSLNYRVETSVQPPPPPSASQQAEAAAAAAALAEAEAMTPRSKGARQKAFTSRQQQQQPQVAAADPAAAAGDAAASAESAAAERAELQRLLSYRATGIVQYAAERATHHSARAIVLGVGATQEGKTIAVGSVASEALRSLSPGHLLFFVKADGFTLRPNTAAVRYVVVVPVSEPGDSSSNGGGDCVGRWYEASAEDREAAAVGAVRRAQSWCRKGMSDRVAVILVVASSSDAEAQGGLLDRYSESLAEVMQSTEAESDPQPQPEVSQGAEEAPAAEDHNEANESNAAAMEWPAISVCEVKPTKHNPNPAIDSAVSALQVAKFIQQRKTEVVVVSSMAPESLQLALMSMTKPHCLVVPFAGKQAV